MYNKTYTPQASKMLKTEHTAISLTGSMCTPYTYYIAWINELGSVVYQYYGIRYATGSHPSDFWVTYKTSSSLVKELTLTLGDPQIIEIRRIFTDVDTARMWEHKVLRRCNVVRSKIWLNQCDVMTFSYVSMIEGWIKKYGIPSYPRNEEYHNRRRKTSIINWGVDHHMKNKLISERVGTTTTRRYGGIGLASEIIKNKVKETVKERYDGVENVFQHESIKAKIRETNLANLGTEYPLSNPIVKDKVKETVKERYDGVENVFQHESIKQKSRQSCMEKYGAPIYSQSDEYKQRVVEANKRKRPIIEKIKNAATKENYKLPHSWQNRSYDNLLLLLDEII